MYRREIGRACSVEPELGYDAIHDLRQNTSVSEPRYLSIKTGIQFHQLLADRFELLLGWHGLHVFQPLPKGGVVHEEFGGRNARCGLLRHLDRQHDAAESGISIGSVA